jgi:very-short-patch-repair endonuclease
MHEETHVVRRADALREGISDEDLAGPHWRKIAVGLYVPADTTTHPVHAVRAALACHPAGAVATHFSAARMLGAPVPPHPDEHITVRAAKDRRRRLGVRCHVLQIEESDVVVTAGVRLSCPNRMFVELARFLGLVDLVVLGDWLVKAGHTTVGSLRLYCRSSLEQHSRRARTAADLVRARSESPQESRLRVLLALAGLPAPAINLEVFDEDGEFMARLDLAYPDLKLAVEYDGAHHADPAQWEADVARRQRLEDAGWRIIVVTRRQLFQHPGRVVDVVARALADRGAELGPLVDAWRPHFRG